MPKLSKKRLAAQNREASKHNKPQNKLYTPQISEEELHDPSYTPESDDDEHLNECRTDEDTITDGSKENDEMSSGGMGGASKENGG